MWRRSNAAWSSSSTSVARSPGRMGVSGMAFILGASSGGGFLVAACVEQLVHVRGVGGLDAEHPCAEGVLVHLLGRRGELRIGVDDLAGDGRVDVGSGLHRL